MTVVHSAALDRFLNPSGVCSADVAAAAGVHLSTSALACTVATTNRKLTISSTREQYGHLVTSAVAKHQPEGKKATYPYFSNVDANHGSDRRKACMQAWNPSTPSSEDHITRVEALRSDPMVGFMLVVVRHWDASTSKYGDPILRVVAAPSLMTCDTATFTHDTQSRIEGSIIAEDVWSPLPAFIATSELLSPLMAAGGGRFREKDTTVSLPDILLATDCLVFPAAFDLAAPVTTAGSTVWRAWLLPLGCNAPIGLTWHLDGLTIDDITQSVQALCPRGAEPFVSLLEQRRDDFVAWLAVITAAPDQVAVSAVPWKDFAPYAPNLLTGDLPVMIEEPDLLGPIQDAIVLYAWRHIVDKLISSPVARVATFFHRYLDQVAPAIHATSYVGFQPPPVLYPNVPYHFPIHGGWPLLPDWFSSFIIAPILSPQAKLWAPSPVDIQDATFIASPMETLSDQEAAAHHQRTPQLAASLQRTTGISARVPQSALRSASPVRSPGAAPGGQPAPATIRIPPALPDPQRHLQDKIREAERSHRQQMETLQAELDASKTTSPTRKEPAPQRKTLFADQADLDSQEEPFVPFDAFRIVPQYSPAAASRSASPSRTDLFSAKQALFAQEQVQSIKWDEATAWTLDSPAQRARCSDDYKALSCLLVHIGYDQATADTITGPETVLLVRAPGVNFCKDVLIPTFTAKSNTVVAPALAFMRMVLYHQQITHFKRVYSERFFYSETLKNVLQISNWEMEETFDPCEQTTTAWNVYSFLQCLASQAPTFTGRLPTGGISIIEAKHLGLFVYHFFRAMDMRDPLKAAGFDTSILATSLVKWLALADHPMMYSLWQSAPRDLTYWWFFSLRAILLPFQTVALTNRFLPDSGFTPDPRQLTISPFCGMNGPHIVGQLTEASTYFRLRWSESQLSSPRSFQAQVLESHFRVPTLSYSDVPTLPGRPSVDKAGGKRVRDTVTPHFTAAQPMFQLLGELPKKPSAVPGKFFKYAGSQTASPMFKLKDAAGKSCNVCLKSCCQPPFNVCTEIPCVSSKRTGQSPNPFIHVDLAQSPWKEKSEAEFADVVEYLKRDGVSRHVAPSQWLKLKTPNASW